MASGAGELAQAAAAGKQREDREIISELDRPAREQIVAELAAALPPGHSFGRRGR